MANPLANKLPKGSYAIAHVQKMAYRLHTGAYHWSRYYVVRVESADREGRVKTFINSPETKAPQRVDRHTKIFALGAEYLDAAKALFERQKIGFTGYMDKEHLRLCLVNRQIEERAS